jgi:hypothetical protein
MLTISPPLSPLSHIGQQLSIQPSYLSTLTVRLRSAYLPRLPAVNCDTYVIVKLFDLSQPIRTFTSALASQSPGRCRFEDVITVPVHHPSSSVLLLQVQLRLKADLPASTSHPTTVTTQSGERPYGHFALAINTLAQGPSLLPLLDRECQPLTNACLGVDMTLVKPDIELQIISPEVVRRPSRDSPWMSPLRMPSLQGEDDVPTNHDDTDPFTSQLPSPVALVQPQFFTSPRGDGRLSPPVSRQRANSSPVKPSRVTTRPSSPRILSRTSALGLSRKASSSDRRCQSQRDWDTVSM